jgi:O-antigen/teichoic acid export membrane protein
MVSPRPDTSEHSVAHRIAIGTISNVAGQVAVLVTSVVLAAVIVHVVGATDFGIWALVGAVASFGFLLELGISAGLVKYVAEHGARGEIDEAALMIGAATWLYALLGGLVCVLGLGAAVTLPAIIGLHGHLARLTQSLSIFTAVDVAISMVAIAPIAVLKGVQRFPAVNAIAGGGALLGAALTIAALAIGSGIVGVAAVGALNSLLVYLVSLVVVRRMLPGYMATPIRRDSGRARRLLRFSRSIAVIQVALRLQTRLDVIVIAAALPIRLVTPYSFAQRLADGTDIATEQFGKLLLPLATEVSTTREPDALRSLYLTATRLTVAISLGVGLPIALLGGPILEIWVGHKFSGYGVLVALLAFAAIVDLPSYPAAAVLQSIERHGPIAKMALASGVVNVGLSIALVGPYGVNGVAAATLVASAIEIGVFVVPYAARVLHVSLRAFMTEVVLPLVLPVGALVGLTIGGAAILPVTSLWRLGAVVGVAVTVYALAYGTIAAGPHERALYRSTAAALHLVPKPPATSAGSSQLPPR